VAAAPPRLVPAPCRAPPPYAICPICPITAPSQGADAAQAAAAFVARWQSADGSELANYQFFVSDLCQLLKVPAPDPVRDDTRDNAKPVGAGDRPPGKRGRCAGVPVSVTRCPSRSPPSPARWRQRPRHWRNPTSPSA